MRSFFQKRTGDQDGQTVPDRGYHELFDAPVTTDASPIKSYAILDGAQAPYILTGLLEASGLTYQSLFQGKTQQELEEYAPYLVELTPGNSFCAKLFTPVKAMGLWERELGVFVQSRVGFQQLRTHLRKFTRVQDQQGGWYYFRYWDPAIMREYLIARDARKDVESARKLASFFRDVIDRAVVCDRDGVTSFDGSVYRDHPPLPFRLDPSDFEILSRVRWRRYKAKLLRILFQDHEADFRIDPAQIDAIAEQAYLRNFRTEIAAYNYVRSHLLCARIGLNFEDALDRTYGGTPTEHARRLWKQVGTYSGNITP